jgi:competence protein ComEA
MFIKYLKLLMLSFSLVFAFSTGIAQAADTAAVPSVSAESKISINKADIKSLSSIKGISAKKAQAIIDYRMKNGDFVSIEELTKVNGIGKATVTKITPYISL